MIDLINILIILGLTVIGVGFLPSLLGNSLVPLLSLFFVVGLTYNRQGVVPVIMAALSGTLIDFYSVSPFGLYTIIFLMTALMIRMFFHEGLKDFSLKHYLFIISVAISIIITAEILLLVAGGTAIDAVGLAGPLLGFISVNLIFGLLMYYLNNRYFEAVKKLEYYQKRR